MTVDSTDSDRKSTQELYVCNLDTDTPPERVSDPKVEKLGEIITDLADVPISQASKRSVATGRTVYQFHYTLEIKLYTKKGTIQVKSTADGKNVDKTVLNFARKESEDWT